MAESLPVRKYIKVWIKKLKNNPRKDQILHVEWKDIDWNNGIVRLYCKIDNDLKTDGSEAPFGMPDVPPCPHRC